MFKMSLSFRIISFNNYTLVRNFCAHNFRVGDIVEISKKITVKDIEQFSSLSGDSNPIHKGEKGVVHGAYLNGLVSGVIGTKLPGAGTLVVAQTLRFPNKCFVGDFVTIQVHLCSIRKLLEVKYKCSVDGKIVLEGDAKLVPEK